VWGSVEQLPPPYNDGMAFFRAALDEKVIVVPGEFFDVNPGKRRHGRASRFKGYVRFSFGPAMPVLVRAIERLEKMVGR
jgi:N-succinyldiaminopimelate aminotransferase